MAKFKVNGVAEIKNRGHALIGEIIEGQITNGQIIYLGNDQSVEIKSIEAVLTKLDTSNVGLMIGHAEGLTNSFLKDIVGRVLLIL
jgi:hypothetical protein